MTMASRVPQCLWVWVAAAICMCLCSCAVSAHIFSPPLSRDAPYVEDVSMRLTTSNANAIAGWAALPVPDVQQVEAGVYNGQEGVFVLSTTQLLFAQLPPTPYGTKSVPQLPPTTAPDATFANVGQLLHMDIVAHSRLAMDAQGALTAVVTPSEVAFVGKASTVIATVAVAMGAVSTAMVATAHDDDTTHVWVGCTQGVLRATLSAGAAASSVWSLQPPNPVASIALSPSGDEVAVGTDQKLYILDATKPGSVIRWEWVTQLSTASGGVVDAPITSMAYDACGSLWIGNAICVNVMFKDRSFIRISGLEGLPFPNSTSVARDFGSLPGVGSVPDMWVGTGQGVARFSPANRECISASNPSAVGDWVYYWGRRWLPGNNVTWVSSHENTTYVGTNGGLARIQHETWTLERKAALFAQIVPRHDRHGFTADCQLPSIGNISGIKCHPGESDGLWTGIMATSEVLRYAVKKDSTSAQLAGRRMDAMNFLTLVTDIGAYMARTAGLVKNGPFGNGWYNSTSFPEWAWQGDTSADEVAGHMFAFPAAQRLLGNATGQQTMIYDRIEHMIGYILSNHYFEVGHDGQHTKWGIWAPSYVNGLRSWSDQRGLNAMQMLSFLNAAYVVTGNATFMDAIVTLSNNTNQYQRNQLNLKIEAPCDDNFSDDELAFLPYYTYFQANASATPALAALVRSYNFARPQRSSLWAAIYMASTGVVDDVAVRDVVWNLQTWPLEWVNWEANNSQRIDIQVNPEVNRDLQHGTMSVRVLPCNERNQFRWNHNPFTLDGGSGTTEFDPGAWLAPYWMARYHGILSS